MHIHITIHICIHIHILVYDLLILQIIVTSLAITPKFSAARVRVTCNFLVGFFPEQSLNKLAKVNMALIKLALLIAKRVRLMELIPFLCGGVV